MNITVYLGSTEGRDPALKHAAQELGNWIGKAETRWCMAGRGQALWGCWRKACWTQAAGLLV